MKKIGIILAVVLIVVMGFWLIAVPKSLIRNRVDTSLMEYNMAIETDELRKGLFYNLRAERVVLNTIGSDDSLRALLILDNIRAKLDILSLLTARPEMDFEFMVNNGSVSGSTRLPEQKTLMLHGRGINIRQLPVMEILNIQGDGTLSFRMSLVRGEGEVRFSVDNLNIKKAGFFSTILPMDQFHAIKGAARVHENRIDIQSVAIKGNGLYARAKGIVRGRSLNMDMEIMLDTSFQPDSLIRTMLARYRVSPGYYRVPIQHQLPQIF